MPRHEIVSVESFVIHCKERGAHTSEAELEALHKLGWLRPLMIGGQPDDVLVVASREDRRRAWRTRTATVPYEPWSSYRSRGVFHTPLWYFTAQVYPLVSIRDALFFGLGLEDCQMLMSNNRAARRFVGRSRVLGDAPDSQIRAWVCFGIEMPKHRNTTVQVKAPVVPAV